MHLSISSNLFSVLYCHIGIIEVCILFFNIFFFFCLKRTNLHIQIVLNVLSYMYKKVFNYKIRSQYLFFIYRKGVFIKWNLIMP